MQERYGKTLPQGKPTASPSKIPLHWFSQPKGDHSANLAVVLFPFYPASVDDNRPERWKMRNGREFNPKVDFSKLTPVNSDSIVEQLCQIIDDIDSGLTMYCPDMGRYELFVVSQIQKMKKVIISDGDRFYYRS